MKPCPIQISSPHNVHDIKQLAFYHEHTSEPEGIADLPPDCLKGTMRMDKSERAHPTSVPKACAMVCRLTETKGAVYCINALLLTCKAAPPSDKDLIYSSLCICAAQVSHH